MSVWVVCPSARPVAEVDARFDKWRRMGYKVALMRDESSASQSQPLPKHDYIELCAKYPGYPNAMNALIRRVFESDPECDWLVCAADDIDPDLSKRAEEIALDCREHFGLQNQAAIVNGIMPVRLGLGQWKYWTFGVMQPTGDRWGENEPHARQMWPDRPAYIDRIAGSPWIGREFARRVNQGRGPWWREYAHMYVDEELYEVARRLGVYWERRDLIHFHDHWGRRAGATRNDIPKFLEEVNSPEHWQRSKALFNARKADGFKGSECIA